MNGARGGCSNRSRQSLFRGDVLGATLQVGFCPDAAKIVCNLADDVVPVALPSLSIQLQRRVPGTIGTIQ